jgi:hypothetical protein
MLYSSRDGYHYTDRLLLFLVVMATTGIEQGTFEYQVVNKALGDSNYSQPHESERGANSLKAVYIKHRPSSYNVKCTSTH